MPVPVRSPRLLPMNFCAASPPRSRIQSDLTALARDEREDGGARGYYSEGGRESTTSEESGSRRSTMVLKEEESGEPRNLSFGLATSHLSSRDSGTSCGDRTAFHTPLHSPRVATPTEIDALLRAHASKVVRPPPPREEAAAAPPPRFAFNLESLQSATPGDATTPKAKTAEEKRARGVCRHFLQGKCSKGARCRFSHDISDADLTPSTVATPRLVEEMRKAPKKVPRKHGADAPTYHHQQMLPTYFAPIPNSTAPTWGVPPSHGHPTPWDAYGSWAHAYVGYHPHPHYSYPSAVTYVDVNSGAVVHPSTPVPHPSTPVPHPSTPVPHPSTSASYPSTSSYGGAATTVPPSAATPASAAAPASTTTPNLQQDRERPAPSGGAFTPPTGTPMMRSVSPLRTVLLSPAMLPPAQVPGASPQNRPDLGSPAVVSPVQTPVVMMRAPPQEVVSGLATPVPDSPYFGCEGQAGRGALERQLDEAQKQAMRHLQQANQLREQIAALGSKPVVQDAVPPPPAVAVGTPQPVLLHTFVGGQDPNGGISGCTGAFASPTWRLMQ